MWKIYPYDADRDFVGMTKYTNIISLLIVLGTILLVAFVGLRWGIDFQGGTELILRFEEDVSDDQVREAAAAIGLDDAQVQRYGPVEQRRFMVQTQDVSTVNEVVVEQLRTNLAELGELNFAEWDSEQPDSMELYFEAPVDMEAIRATVEETGVQLLSVSESGQAQDAQYTLRFEDLQSIIRNGLVEYFGEGFSAETGLEGLETVGPRAGQQLRNDGMWAVIIAMLAILVYLWFRFDIRYSLGAVVALAHDVVVAIGFFIILDIEISLTIVAALLAIVGYSLNDTIVIFDRVRENLESAGSRPIRDVVNEAINQTMSRTLMTSITTLGAVLAIAIIATGQIQDFGTALVIGIIGGAYSSTFIAPAVMLKVDQYLRERREAEALLQAQAAKKA